MPRRAQEWSPRGEGPPAAFGERARAVIRSLRAFGQSEADSIADQLEDALDDGALDPFLAIAILEEFQEIARWAIDEFMGRTR